MTTTTPCPHLESLIQSKPSQSVAAIPTGKIDKYYYESGAGYILPKEIRDRTWELAFRTKLLNAGLEEVKVDILVLRFIYEMSLVEISEELGFLSHMTVLNYLNDSLKYLKKIGFKR